MAQVTDRLATIGESFVEVTYDDVTFRLSSARAVCAVPISLWIARPNGTSFRDVRLPIGETVISFPAGPIRDLDDIPSWGLGS